MNDDWTAADDVIEEIREIRRQISAEFGDDVVAFGAYFMEYEKQFADRLVTREQLDARRAAEIEAEGKSAA